MTPCSTSGPVSFEHGVVVVDEVAGQGDRVNLVVQRRLDNPFPGDRRAEIP